MNILELLKELDSTFLEYNLTKRGRLYVAYGFNHSVGWDIKDGHTLEEAMTNLLKSIKK